MKYLFVILLTGLTLAQTKEDSTELKRLESEFRTVQKAYITTDSLQIKRKGVMEYLASKYSAKLQAIEEKKKLNSKEKIK